MVEKSRKKRSLEKRNPRKSETRQQSAWRRNQNVDVAGARPPAPPSEPAPSAPPDPVPPPEDRAAEAAAADRRSWLCGSSDFIIAAARRIYSPSSAAADSNRSRAVACVDGWILLLLVFDGEVGGGRWVKCGARNCWCGDEEERRGKRRGEVGLSIGQWKRGALGWGGLVPDGDGGVVKPSARATRRVVPSCGRGEVRSRWGWVWGEFGGVDGVGAGEAGVPCAREVVGDWVGPGRGSSASPCRCLFFCSFFSLFCVFLAVF